MAHYVDALTKKWISNIVDSREFLRHWGSYILLIVGTNIALEMLVIPLVQFLIAFIKVNWRKTNARTNAKSSNNAPNTAGCLVNIVNRFVFET
jgi:hypothetical protein